MSSEAPPQSPSLLPPIPVDQLQWAELPNRFNERSIRRILRELADVEFESLRQEVSDLASFLRADMSIPITDAELSRLFGHAGGWAQGMITKHMRELVRIGPGSGPRSPAADRIGK